MRKEAIQEFFNKSELKGKLDNQVEKPPEVIVHCAK